MVKNRYSFVTGVCSHKIRVIISRIRWLLLRVLMEVLVGNVWQASNKTYELVLGVLKKMSSMVGMKNRCLENLL